MRVLATTVVRESIRGKQRTGYIYDIDWDAQRVVRRLPVPEPEFPETEDNPRGGVRGGRGVAVTRHGIVVANYDTLIVYDDDWNVVDRIGHPLFVGTHEIDWDGDHIWTAATAIDAVLRVSLEDRSVVTAWDPHHPEAASRFRISIRPHPVDGSVDYRRREAPLLDQCHLNGVTRHDGLTVVNCGLIRPAKSRLAKLRGRVASRSRSALRIAQRETRRHAGSSAVLRLNGSREAEVLVQLDGNDYPTHNGQLLDAERVVLNDSTANTFRVFSLAGDELASHAIPGRWLRGLEPLDGHCVLLGSAPASVSLLDLREGGVVACLRLSEDPNEAVHGLTLCPEPAERR
jgi:hypothetical protein